MMRWLAGLLLALSIGALLVVPAFTANDHPDRDPSYVWTSRKNQIEACLAYKVAQPAWQKPGWEHVDCQRDPWVEP